MSGNEKSYRVIKETISGDGPHSHIQIGNEPLKNYWNNFVPKEKLEVNGNIVITNLEDVSGSAGAADGTHGTEERIGALIFRGDTNHDNDPNDGNLQMQNLAMVEAKFNYKNSSYLSGAGSSSLVFSTFQGGIHSTNPGNNVHYMPEATEKVRITDDGNIRFSLYDNIQRRPAGSYEDIYMGLERSITRYADMQTSLTGAGPKLGETHKIILGYDLDNPLTYSTEGTKYCRHAIKFQLGTYNASTALDVPAPEPTTKMIITDSGYVGIGTTNPESPLHVKGVAPGRSVYSAVYTDGSTSASFHSQGTRNPRQFTLITENNIWCQGSEIHVSSDSRIKTDIYNVDDDRALQQVNKLETKEYHYIDPERRRPMKTIGFIAQEVKDVIPNAVSLQTMFVPDEMRMVTEPQWDINVLTIPNLNMTPKNLTGKCKFYVSNDPSGTDEVMKDIECIKDASGNNTNRFNFDKNYTNVFFYGKEVNDFHTIDKNQIFALHHSAIQELSRRNDAKTEKIQTLENEVNTLKEEMKAIKEKLGLL